MAVAVAVLVAWQSGEVIVVVAMVAYNSLTVASMRLVA